MDEYTKKLEWHAGQLAELVVLLTKELGDLRLEHRLQSEEHKSLESALARGLSEDCTRLSGKAAMRRLAFRLAAVMNHPPHTK